MEIESLKKVKLESGDILLVEVDIGTLPSNRANQFLQEVKAAVMRDLGDIRCMVIPLHRIRVSVLNIEDALVKESDAKDSVEKASR